MKIFNTALLSLTALYGSAQMNNMSGMGNMKMDTNVTFHMFRNIGASYQKFDGLYDRIAKFPQYRDGKKIMGTLAGGGITEKGRFVSIGTLTVGHSLSGSKNKKSSSLAFAGISADWGYNLLPKESRLAIYPTLGIGLEYYRARFNRDVTAVQFDTVLQNNNTQNLIRPLVFTNLFFNYRGTLNFALKSADGMGAIGLQAGYTGSFTKREWRVNDYQMLQNAPKDALSRIFANLYISHNLKWKHKKMQG